MFRPIYLVTEYRNVKRANPANEYTGGKERIDCWKAGMIHGYYAGMGMDFFFPSEGEASRFSLFTIYDPSQIIDLMENRKFTVSSIKKTMQMSARSPYTGARMLKDSWRVVFEGEHDEFLETYHPEEWSARRFSFGAVYTMQDVLGTLPAIPRDVAFMLAEIARQAREAEARRLEEERKKAEEEAGQTPTTPPITVDPPQVDPPTTPPPTPPGPDLAGAIGRDWTVTNGGAAGYYALARDSSYTRGQRYDYPYGTKNAYGYHSQGQTFLYGANFSEPFLSWIPTHGVSNFTFFGFFVPWPAGGTGTTG